ncbi:MAG: DUF3014 domain-containing protein [Methylococcaceae bacterium]|nr:DUF3014 domain-containing protein [Methylococcaceae bacterium]
MLVLGVVILFALAGSAWFYQDRLKQELMELLDSKPANAELNEAGIVELEPAAAADENLLDTDTEAENEGEWQVPQEWEEPSVDLPKLSDSDKSFQQALASSSPDLAPWLRAGQLIRRYVTIANDFSQGITVESHMRFLKPDQAFTVELRESQMFISKKSYQRFDALAVAIQSIDVMTLVETYKKFRPLLVQVFAEFSYPEEFQLEDILEKAAEQILAAPIIEERIELIRPSVQYKFADKKLESLDAVSKQMLRMGPDNTRIVQNKVQDLVEAFATLQ